MKPREYYGSIATMTGCIIGAGILGIPYVVVKAGFWTGMIVLLAIGFAALVIHLLLGEVTLRSNKSQQLVGYANKYLGKKGKFLMAASMIIGINGSLIAYILGVSESLTSIFGFPQWWWAVLFYALMAMVLFGGIKVLAASEFWMELIKYGLFAAILALLFNSHHFSSFRFTPFNASNLLVPYGVILFAIFGTSIIPEVREELRKKEHLMKSAIIAGCLITTVFYALFTIGVVGVSGETTTEVASIGLAQLIGGYGFLLLHVFAIIAMATSFIALGYALKEVYKLDFKLTNTESWALTLVVPAIVVLIGVESFVSTLQFTGTFAGGLAGIMIILIHSKSRKKSERKPEYTVKINWIGYSLLIALFIIGMINELLGFI